MTLKSLITGHVPGVFLNEDHFAESITHYPGGSGAGVAVTAIVERADPRLREVNGIETRQGITLQVSSSVTCLETDRWSIAGKLYETLTVGEVDVGWQSIEITRVQKTSQGDADAEVL